MAQLFVPIAHLLKTLLKLLRPGGVAVVVEESRAIKQQLQAVRSFPLRKLLSRDRPTFDLYATAPVARKYRWLYSSAQQTKPGPNGPSAEVMLAVIEMKQRTPRMGCRKIAEQLSRTFGIEINKDIARRISAKHPLSGKSSKGPSCETALADAKDSLWSIDWFRCGSILLQSWVVVVLNVFSSEVIGFGVQGGGVNGAAVCRMFNEERPPPPRPAFLPTTILYSAFTAGWPTFGCWILTK